MMASEGWNMQRSKYKYNKRLEQSLRRTVFLITLIKQRNRMRNPKMGPKHISERERERAEPAYSSSAILSLSEMHRSSRASVTALTYRTVPSKHRLLITGVSFPIKY
jgi:hypothetical protein